MNQSLSFKFESNVLRNNPEKINAELAKIIDFLSRLEHPSRIFDDYSSGYHAVILLGKIIHHFENETDFGLFTSNLFEVFVSYLFAYIYEIKSELNFLIATDASNAEDAVTLNEKRILVFIYLLCMTNIIVNRSKEFCVEFLLHGGLKTYLLFVGDEAFIEKNKNSKIKDLTKNPLRLFDYLILNMATLCTRTCDEHKQLWLALDSIAILLKIAKLQESTSFDAQMIIAMVVSDEQIEELAPEMSLIVDKLVKLLLKSSNDLLLRMFHRLQYQIYFKGKSLSVQTQSVEYKKTLYISMIELIQSLYKLSVNERIKVELYFKHDIMSILKVFLSKGTIFI